MSPRTPIPRRPRAAALWPEELVVVDTETTGFGAARLVEVAALLVRGGAVAGAWQTLVDPRESIPRAATQVHGITDAMVRGAPRAPVVLRELLDFAAGRPLVAHFAGFDRGILAGELRRAGMDPPALEWFCTMRVARRVVPDAPNHKLGTLVEYLRVAATPTHRALADAHAAHGVLRACLQRAGLSLREVHGRATVF